MFVYYNWYDDVYDWDLQLVFLMYSVIFILKYLFIYNMYVINNQHIVFE